MKKSLKTALLVTTGLLCLPVGLWANDYQFGKTPEIKKVKLTPDFYPAPLEKDPALEFENAMRGYIDGTALTDTIWVQGEAKIPAWNMPAFDFIQGDAPATVHPTLWTMEKLNNINGLFQVLPKVDKGGKDGVIYQVRSYDLATMSIIKGQTGWIVVDPLTGKENAAHAWKQFKEKVDPNAKVSAIIITHSHVDHYKGIEGVIDASDIWEISQDEYIKLSKNPKKLAKAAKNKVLVVGPTGFYSEALSENLLLGNCMERRGVYMYGVYTPASPYQLVGTGLGKKVSFASGSLLKPSFEVVPNNGKTCELVIDGMHILFQNVPGTEAPAEFHFFIKEYNTLCPGENVCHTMHNLLTPRGAKVRNAKAFGDAIDEAMQIADDYFGGDIQVLLGTHHWPTWGNEACRDMMSKQRDMYYYFNNQVIHMLNKGMNMTEIAEEFALPASLSNEYYNRGYYGTINHNVKAVAQFYTGWWDGNPANYFTYPEAEEAKRFVADMGGEEAVLAKAHEYFKKGDYRWTVELTKQLVFNNPQNKEARYLQADALEQLGYSFEAGTWRNIFLAGASDLRTGGLSGALSTEQTIQIMVGNMRVMQPAFIFDYFAILLDGSKAGADNADYAVTVKIADAYYQLHLYNGVLHAKKVDADASAIVFDSVSAFVDDFAARMRALNVKENTNTVEKSALDNIYQYFELFDAGWNIVEPLK